MGTWAHKAPGHMGTQGTQGTRFIILADFPVLQEVLPYIVDVFIVIVYTFRQGKMLMRIQNNLLKLHYCRSLYTVGRGSSRFFDVPYVSTYLYYDIVETYVV